MTAAALLAVAAGMALVRRGWGGERRVAAFGWLLALAALVVLARADGAWGIAIGFVVAMACALALVLRAAAISPARAYRAPREAPAVALPRRMAGIRRRLAVFALSVPIAFAAAWWLGFGIQAAARGAGAGVADATALMLFLPPVLWTVIVTVQMTRAGPSRMIAAPAVAALLGTLLWGIA